MLWTVVAITPGGWGQGRGLAPSPHKPDPGHDGTERGCLPVATPGRSSWTILDKMFQ